MIWYLVKPKSKNVSQSSYEDKSNQTTIIISGPNPEKTTDYLLDLLPADYQLTKQFLFFFL